MSIIIENIVPKVSLDFLKKGIYILLYKVDEIPPHIKFISNGKLYSISVRGTEKGVGVDGFVKLLEIKKTPCLFVELETNGKNFEHILEAHFTNGEVLSEESSCLVPIKLSLSEYYENKFKGSFIFELLPELATYRLIKSYFSYRMEENNHTFSLKTYKKEDIKNCISRKKLKEKTNA